MANDDPIAALERLAKMLSDEASSVECSSYHEHSLKAAAAMEADAARIRAHIADLKAGGTTLPALLGYDAGVADERARVVAYLETQSRLSLTDRPLWSAAKAIASGAHMENNNAD